MSCFINLSGERREEEYAVCVEDIARYIGHKMVDRERFVKASAYQLAESENTTGRFSVSGLDAYDCVTYRVTPV